MEEFEDYSNFEIFLVAVGSAIVIAGIMFKVCFYDEKTIVED